MRWKILDLRLVAVFALALWLISARPAHGELSAAENPPPERRGEAALTPEDQAAAEMADMLQVMELLEKMELIADLDVLDEGEEDDADEKADQPTDATSH